MSYDHPYVEKYRHRDIILCCGQGAWEDEMIRLDKRECRSYWNIRMFQRGLIFGGKMLTMIGTGGRFNYRIF